MDPRRYSIGELARLTGVSARTVRYYITEGLLPAALGRGRGEHYDSEHLARLLAIRAMQEVGHELDLIRALMRHFRMPEPGDFEVLYADPDWSPETAPAWAKTVHRQLLERLEEEREQTLEVPRSAWSRLELAPGIELHVSADYRLPSPTQLRSVAEQVRGVCRRRSHG